MKRLTVIVCIAGVLPAQAHAGEKWEIQPVQIGYESVRYSRGIATVQLEQRDGVVQITPLPLDHGRMSFAIAVYNDGLYPANFDIGNVMPAYHGLAVSVLTRSKLQSMAKRRAFWTKFGLAMLGGVAAGLSASQRNTYHSTYVTPRGTYRSWYSVPSAAGQFQAAVITAGTAASIVMVQRQLDQTVAALGEQIVQLTTVDPGESYAGRIVMDKVPLKERDEPITLTVRWNDEDYLFAFRVVRSGTPQPVFTNLRRASDLTDFSKDVPASQVLPADVASASALTSAPAAAAREVPASVVSASAKPVREKISAFPAAGARVAQAVPAADQAPPTEVRHGAVVCVTCRR
ncbi:hypothetical protein [Novosphingobium mangrovi (ex Huang et al. 2023)]|uniref:Uncharacterized protein n=1 Tax=Novosphingobium mangrovi (ex Huang et al. 2023) TaxID=2976432 RepID=A0ABT2I126_9SPHN|nr:hypothetical protein [Novosphingobium mangrovi (ex Huang et al. 2023)]MCT2398500.1 hypothetical protein [Novosphingobium mangrovi (ex Huang et al. 2023)]